jgi:hypothetical protein
MAGQVGGNWQEQGRSAMPARISIFALALLVSGCAQIPQVSPPTGKSDPAAPGTAATPPPRDAVTVEQFDTTSSVERQAAATAPPAASEVWLGRTIASLGDPSDPGFWAETGLVDSVRPGRLEYPGASTTVKVELRPSGGAPGAGTRVSLPAMRVLGAPLTELPELVVFGG